MKVVSKNCSKQVSNEKQRRHMAEIGASAYLSPRSTTSASAIACSKTGQNSNLPPRFERN
jgi:hypothetical protein